jgi:hypothetical protein
VTSRSRALAAAAVCGLFYAGAAEAAAKPYTKALDEARAKTVEAGAAAQDAIVDYFYRDFDQAKIAKSLEKTLGARQKDFMGKRPEITSLGIAFVLLGGIGALVFGFQLLLKTFDAGLAWGFSYLALVATNVPQLAAKLGPWQGPVAAVSMLLLFAYTALYWNAARKPTVGQILSVAMMFFGFYLWKLS